MRWPIPTEGSAFEPMNSRSESQHRHLPNIPHATRCRDRKTSLPSLSVLLREGSPESDPWRVQFAAMLHMANDSGLFKDRAEMENDGWRLEGSTFVKGKLRYVPLYEAKMVHHFDHRLGTYDGQTQAQSNQGILPRLTPEQHADPGLSCAAVVLGSRSRGGGRHRRQVEPWLVSRVA